MEEWDFGTTIKDLKGLSEGCIPPFPTKNQGVFPEARAQCLGDVWGLRPLGCRVQGLGFKGFRV